VSNITQSMVPEGTRALTLPAGPGLTAPGRALARVLPAIAGAAVVAAGSAAGLWYLPFAAGLAAGICTRLTRAGRLAAVGYAVASSLGWPAVLLWRALAGQPIGATARAAAGLAGLPPLAALTIAVTVLIALLQSLAGAWLARSVTAAIWNGTESR
jgi:hypothetical protein